MTELLSPAGSWEAMVAAVQNGADAVYMGFGAFNARAGAHNFTEDALREAVRYCHIRGVKVYVTLNILLTDRELDELARLARAASDAGVDAILVQDWGVFETIRAAAPDVPIHASTQMSIHTLSGARECAALGMERAVLARELSGSEICEICEGAGIEIETFAHGALCMCYSGQCAMSALIGGRSGNRGRCAQPCRLPYTVGGKRTGYPLSLKDLCLGEHVPALIEAGVASLKIEGRMKAPEYVHAVTRVWRKLLDERRAATAEEMAYLAEIFSRGGFTDRYFTHTDRRTPDWTGRGMLGVRSEDDKQNTRALPKWTDGAAVTHRKLPVTLEATLRRDCPAVLSMSCEGKTVTVMGDIPQIARKESAAMTEESVAKSLCKLGSTPFEATEIRVAVDSGLMLPAAALNALRRDAAERLLTERSDALARQGKERRVERLPYVPAAPSGGSVCPTSPPRRAAAAASAAQCNFCAPIRSRPPRGSSSI